MEYSKISIGVQNMLIYVVEVTINLILLSYYFAFETVHYFSCSIVTDACQAMRDYNENPESSSFAKLLPCLNATDANKSLDLAKFAIKNLLSQMNGAIDIINEREKMMRVLHPTGPYNITLKHFCDPFGPPPDYQDIQCSPNYSNFSTFETVRFLLNNHNRKTIITGKQSFDAEIHYI